MQYHGGKSRIGQELANVIYEQTIAMGFCPKGYVEPFCGMLGVYRHIPELFDNFQQCNNNKKIKYLASDINTSLILMWQALQKNWKPSTKLINKREFFRLKQNEESSAEKGYIGHFYGYMGKYFVTFDHRHTPKQAENQSERMVQVAQALKKVKFSQGSYTIHSSLQNFVIYCDSPYKESSRYYQEGGKSQPKFDHDQFWEWCREMSKNNLVFVSAYSAPQDFTEIFHISSKTPSSSRVERLFIY